MAGKYMGRGGSMDVVSENWYIYIVGTEKYKV